MTDDKRLRSFVKPVDLGTAPHLRLPRLDIMQATHKVGGSRKRGRQMSNLYTAALARRLQANGLGPLPFRGR